MTLRRNTSAFVAVTVMQRGAVPMLQVMCAAMSRWRVRGRMGMSGRCAELMRWEFEGAFRSIISPAFCRFLSPSVALNILFSGGVVKNVCAVWPCKAGFPRRLLEGYFRGLRGKRRGCFWGRSAGKGEGGFSGSEGGGSFEVVGRVCGMGWR